MNIKGKTASLVGVVSLSAFALTACGSSATGEATLVYEVGGTATSALVTYTSGTANISQEEGATIPWTKTVEVSGLVAGNSVSAQNSGGGDITCKITRDGEVVAENTSSGEFAIVTCTVP